jgi:hypothetical protein
MRPLSRKAFVILIAFCASNVGAQTPPDTVKRDTTRVTTLGPMRTEAARLERQIFEQAPAVGRISLGVDEIKAAPRFFSEADLLRTVQLLPGVEAKNDFSAGMNVRGGESDQNLVLLDGYPIYNPFHLGGLFGTFVEPMVGRVEVFTGAFPASYGNRLSSVLDVRSAIEAREGIHGTANISLIASQMSLGSSFAAGTGTWKVAARRTYIDRAVKMLTPEEMPYDFRDLQGHVAREFSNGVRAAVTLYAGHDRFDYTDSVGTWGFEWGNRVFGTTVGRTFQGPTLFGRSLGDSMAVEQRASVSTFDADVQLGSVIEIHSPVRDWRTSGVYAFFSPKHTRSVGWEVARQRLRYNSNFEFPIFPSDTESYNVRSASAHFNDLWRPNEKWVVDGGARLDVVHSIGWAGVSPSLSAKYFVNPNLAITGGVGQYAQWVRSLAREEVPIRPLDFWVASNEQWPVSRARHFIIGTEGWIDRHKAFRVEAFYKTYKDLLERNPVDDAQRDDDNNRVLRGSSIGADFLLRRLRSDRFTGWIAYTFAINSRRDSAGNKFAPSQDRRHDVNLVGNWQYRKYTLAARYNFATGTPYTYLTGSYTRLRFNPGTGEYEERDDGPPQFLASERNGARLPATQRFDVSIMRNGHIRKTAVAPYLSVVNAMNIKNVFTYVFDYTAYPVPTRVTLHQLSIVPTIGVAISW